MRASLVRIFGVCLVIFLVACGSAADDAATGPLPASEHEARSARGNGDDGDDSPIVAVAEPAGPADPGPPLDAKTAMTTSDVNLRKGPATTFDVLLVIPSGATVAILDPNRQNDFLNVKFNGTSGWVSAAYLQAAGAPATPGNVNGPPSVANALARAAVSKGFSYFWGGGAFPGTPATDANRGSCTGSCPDCTHAGTFGADCSGLVAKAWQLGDVRMEVNSHPYGTVHFVNDVAGKWTTVSRGALQAADALVYNEAGAGHIVVWEKGDGFGASTVYECKGCVAGCVYNTRTFTSAYHGIRRAGF